MTVPERVVTVFERFESVVLVLASPHERVEIFATFCETTPERVVTVLAREVRLPERVSI